LSPIYCVLYNLVGKINYSYNLPYMSHAYINYRAQLSHTCMFSVFQLTVPQVCFYHACSSALFVLLTASGSITVHLPSFFFNFIGTSSAICSDSGHISVPPPVIHTVFINFLTASFYLCVIKFSQFSSSFAFSSQFSYLYFVFYIVGRVARSV